ncbi:hypothetical protein KC644_02955 [Candidatus Berkelbacteria bacterium]|nr:hypothetical protein [Candidatus Berkelbacteria bacterium]
MSKFWSKVVLVFLLLSVGATAFYFGFNLSSKSHGNNVQEEDFPEYDLFGEIVDYNNNILRVKDQFGLEQIVDITTNSTIFIHSGDSDVLTGVIDDLQPGRFVIVDLISSESYGGFTVNLYLDRSDVPEGVGLNL